LSNPQIKEKTEKDKKVRVFALAKELNVDSKVLVDLCKELGFAGITSQLNGLETPQADALRERVKKGPKVSSPSAAPVHAPAKPVIPPVAKDNRIQTLPKAKPTPKVATETPLTALTTPTAPVAPPHTTSPVAEDTAPVAEAPTPEAPAVVARAPEPVAPPKADAPPTPPQNIIPNLAGGGMRNLPGKMQNLNTARPAPVQPRPASPQPTAPPAATVPAPEAVQPVAPVSPAAAPTPPAEPAAPATVAGPAPAVTHPTSPSAPPAKSGTPPAPQPRVSPPNVIPTNTGANTGSSGRPDVLKRPPQVAPPKFIADRRTGVGAPPPGSGPRPQGGPHGGQPGGGGQRTGAPQGGGGGGGQRTGGPQGQGGGGAGAPPKPGPANKAGGSGAGTPMKLTPEMIERLRLASARGQKMSIADAMRPVAPAPAGPAGPPRGAESKSGQGSASRIAGRPPAPEAPSIGGPSQSMIGDDEDDKKKKAGGGVIGRDSRHRGRQGSGRGPGSGQPAIVVGTNGQVDIIEQQWGSRRGPRAALLRKHMRGKVAPIIKEGKIEIALPITVRSLSEAIGMKVGELSKRLLKETGQLYGNNSTMEFDTAALIAVEKNIELVVKKQETAEDRLLTEFQKLLTEVEPEKLRPRPPIVAVMGHVDHGKTSLLDKIRQNYGHDSDVVSTEAGGITQVIRAWSVKREVIVDKEIDGVTQEVHEDRFITFLDTPGHEAFTKMRARGANVTDIAVIVVAATDGVMPQTQEAISHAKAAEVKIVVAINKVDMPNANLERTKRQLYTEGLIPDDMGGDVQFIETSAVTGQGIAQLLDTIVLVAEVEELTADPDRPAAGTCLESTMTADEGVMATVLIQQGTLRKGDIVLCGSAFGRVRAMYNDVGKPVTSAGPSTPVRITGLDHVPNADDPFYVVDELTKAQEIAETREQKEREAALNRFSAPKDLGELSAAKSKAKISELKVILKAEARGSVEAIRKELEKLTHEEVTTRILHAGIGAINESDVELALTSPEDTLVIGFNVTADDAAIRLAEDRGISLREYDIIYKLTDDVKSALEGRLKPIEEVVHLGRAVIRQTFKVGKVGTIAGCFVTSGTLERSARVRVIRQGVVVFPPSDKVVGLDSLKRFKDDAKEVREGFECGLKITGYDDLKVDDVIEAFKIEIRQRTL